MYLYKLVWHAVHILVPGNNPCIVLGWEWLPSKSLHSLFSWDESGVACLNGIHLWFCELLYITQASQELNMLSTFGSIPVTIPSRSSVAMTGIWRCTAAVSQWLCFILSAYHFKICAYNEVPTDTITLGNNLWCLSDVVNTNVCCFN